MAGPSDSSDSDSRERTSSDSDSEGSSRAGDLPDLTERLRTAGVYDEYQAYWSRYKSWRKGGNKGARGEMLVSASPSKVEDAEEGMAVESEQRGMLLGTPQKFSFFFTIAFWVAIWSTVGAMQLSFTHVTPLFLGEDRAYNPHMMHWIMFLGDIGFTIGAYLNYIEMINLPRRSGRVRLCCRKRRQGGDKKSQVTWVSWLGIMGYFLGMLIWDVAAIADLLPEELEGIWATIFVEIPNFLGAVGFVIGGICEILHNRDTTPMQKEWWAAFFNCVGDFFFFLGVCVGYHPYYKKWCPHCYAIGIVCFVFGGILFIMLWRSNDFGFTLLRQLNVLEETDKLELVKTKSGKLNVTAHAAVVGKLESVTPLVSKDSEGEHDEKKKGEKLSSRDVGFLVVYSWLLAVTMMNSVVSVWHAEPHWRHISDIFDCSLWMIVVMLILVVHSAITTVPNHEPYKTAMHSLRAVLLIAAVVQTINFVKWLPEPDHKHPILIHNRTGLVVIEND